MYRTLLFTGSSIPVMCIHTEHPVGTPGLQSSYWCQCCIPPVSPVIRNKEYTYTWSAWHLDSSSSPPRVPSSAFLRYSEFCSLLISPFALTYRDPCLRTLIYRFQDVPWYSICNSICNHSTVSPTVENYVSVDRYPLYRMRYFTPQCPLTLGPPIP